MAARRPLVIVAGRPQQIPANDSLECEGVLLKGAVDAFLRSNGGRVETRNAGNTAFAPFRCTDLYCSSTIYFDAVYRYVYSIDAPISPAVGDRWLEIDSVSGQPKYGWEWRWNGTYWLSPEQYFYADPMGAAASVNRFFTPDSAFNYYFQDLIFTANVATTNNGSNYWGVSLLRVATTTSTTIFTGGNTAANTAGNWVSSARSAINTHVNVASTSAQAFYLRFATTGSPGALSGGATLIYCYARK